jgi:hypothetical protein
MISLLADCIDSPLFSHIALDKICCCWCRAVTRGSGRRHRSTPVSLCFQRNVWPCERRSMHPTAGIRVVLEAELRPRGVRGSWCGRHCAQGLPLRSLDRKPADCVRRVSSWRLASRMSCSTMIGRDVDFAAKDSSVHPMHRHVSNTEPLFRQWPMSSTCPLPSAVRQLHMVLSVGSTTPTAPHLQLLLERLEAGARLRLAHPALPHNVGQRLRGAGRQRRPQPLLHNAHRRLPKRDRRSAQLSAGAVQHQAAKSQVLEHAQHAEISIESDAGP